MRKDDDLEKYLTEFRPRAVRPLELAPPAPRAWPRRLAIAAMVLICTGMGLRYGLRGTAVAPTPPPKEPVQSAANPGRMNSFFLTKLALEDDRQFQVQLAAESRLVLPNFHGEKSMLRVLAKE